MLVMPLSRAKSLQEALAFLVGGWTNPVEKYACQNGSFPQIGVKIEKNETTI